MREIVITGNRMPLWRAIRRAAGRNGAAHFHVDLEGRAFACYGSDCPLPILTLREASLTETGARRRTR
jgi:hypothetical protein